MPARRFVPPIDRRRVETVLAASLILFTIPWFVGLRLPVVNAALVEFRWVSGTVVVPGALALSVLAGVVAHAGRLAALLFGDADRARPGDATPARMVASLVLGVLAAYTLFWVAGSFYVLYVAERGGVLLAPLVALIVGNALAVLVLLRAALRKRFPEGLETRFHEPIVD